jgi:hypothetical protein
MLKSIRFILIILLSWLSCYTQSTSSTPILPPPPTPIPTPKISDLNAVNSNKMTLLTPEFRKIVDRETDYLYRKPTKIELQNIAPNEEDKEKYADFLKQDKTGLIRLIPDLGCSDNVKILVASDDCLKYSMPGNGSAFSFRTNNYRIWRLADLVFAKNVFHAVGSLSQGILVNLGNVPIESVTLNSEGVEFLNKFQPEIYYKEAKKQDKELIKGIRSNKYFYRKGLLAIENSTYVLRSIAYQGKLMRSEKGLIYNELEYDRRKDVTIVFRLIRKNADGSVNILWKELQRKDSPKIKIKEDKK